MTTCDICEKEIKKLEQSKFDHLGRLLQNPDISEVELELLIQTAIHIISGNNTLESLIEVYKTTNNKHIAIIESAAGRKYE